MPGSTEPLEEDVGVLKSGVVIAGFAPIKSKKTYYAVLCERALELHESEKSYRKKKPARHLIDLSIAFNIHNDHFDSKLKRCVCLMGPDETLCLRADDGRQSTDGRLNTEWYDAILSAVIPSRVLRLGRPIKPQEFFECAWDVEIVTTPKLKKPVRCEETLQNMCSRQPGLAGPKRLCFYAHTIVLCKRRIEPATQGVPVSGIPPFHTDDFIELPRKFVAFFGCQEKFFLMRIGRGAPMGASELWAQCDTDEVALDIHNKLNMIIERESEKKKKMNNGVVVPPGLLSMRSHHHGHAHRERSHTQPMRQRTPSLGNPDIDGMESLSVPAVSTRDRRAQLREGKARLDSSFDDEACSGRISGSSLRPRGSLGNPAAFQLELLGRRVGSPASLSNSMLGRKPSAGSSFGGSLSARAVSVCQGSPLSQQHSHISPPMSIFPPQTRRQSDCCQEEPGLYQAMCARPSSLRQPSPSTSANEETEDSGGTLRLDSQREGIGSTKSSQRSLVIAEATIERRRNSKDMLSDGDERSSVGGVSGLSEGASTGPSSSSTQEDSYAPMDAAEWSYGSNSHLLVPAHYERERYNLEEVRSYVSDSSDSCYSSMAANGSSSNAQNIPGSIPNPPRAYSFGGRCNLKPVGHSSTAGVVDSGHSLDSRGGDVTGTGLLPPPDDPRKRAFSLGSKSFFQRPFRKISQHASRQQRHSQTSASGISLASSAASSFGPPSSSTNHLATATEKEDYSRNRSGSFGSGRSTPYNRRGGSIGVSGVREGQDHLVEIDFGNGIGRSGSGSVASVDSPSRSRTSSFGCGVRKDEIFGYPSEPHDSELKPSDIVLQQVKQNSVDDGGDYVMTEVPDLRAVHDAIAETQAQAASGFISPGDGVKSIDMRNSQYFETIEENTSLKSSPCSSRNSVVMADGDGYTVMEVGPSIGPVVSAPASPHGGSMHIISPCTRPDRSASSPVRDNGDMALVPPTGLPKRSSVPTLKSHEARDDSGLNYACLQVQCGELKTASIMGESLLPVGSGRTRSKSGILYSRQNESSKVPLDYAAIKPI